MHSKKACLIINPRAGQNLAKINEILAVLAAAGWETKIAIKEYGGHAMKLASKAASEDYDMVIAYGGDGTLNQVVNGVVNAKGQHSIVGILPGGTANEWATEIGVPPDTLKATLALVDSEVRKVDIGHVEVEGLTFLNSQTSTPATADSQTQAENQHNGSGNVAVAAPATLAPMQKNKKGTAKAKHHFLLMAGLGIDAAIMKDVSKPLKYQVGQLAVGVSALKKLPEQQPFTVEVRGRDDEDKEAVLWRGEALQVIVGNSRRYASYVEMTPDAFVDDGLLDVCVITAGSPLSTMGQVMSLLLRRKPDNVSAEYFKGAHLKISAPASTGMQLDGSVVKLKDYLSKSALQALGDASDPKEVLVHYTFDAMPRALRAAIPNSYNNTIFKNDEKQDEGDSIVQQEHATAEQEQAAADANQAQEDRHSEDHKQNSKVADSVMEHLNSVREKGYPVTVHGTAPGKDQKHAYYILAGTTQKQSTGEDRPVAVRLDDKTIIADHEGRVVTPNGLHQLKDGARISVEGDKNKRGVIQATHVVID